MLHPCVIHQQIYGTESVLAIFHQRNSGISFTAETAIIFEAEGPTPNIDQSFGFAVRIQAGSIGDYSWIDPANDLIAIFMSQAPEHRLPYRYRMRQLVDQALEG